MTNMHTYPSSSEKKIKIIKKRKNKKKEKNIS